MWSSPYKKSFRGLNFWSQVVTLLKTASKALSIHWYFTGPKWRRKDTIITDVIAKLYGKNILMEKPLRKEVIELTTKKLSAGNFRFFRLYKIYGKFCQPKIFSAKYFRPKKYFFDFFSWWSVIAFQIGRPIPRDPAARHEINFHNRRAIFGGFFSKDCSIFLKAIFLK